MDNGITATIDRAKPGRESFSVEGVLYSISTDGLLSVTADCQTISLKAAECEEWLATVPAGNQTLMRIVPSEGRVEVIAPVTNVRPVRVRLCDDGWADVGPGGQIRFEQLKDQSYFVWGAGNVTAVNADGQTMTLSPKSPPMTGGPIEQTTGPSGTPRLRRVSPVVAATAAGDPAIEVTLVIGGSSVVVRPGEPQRIVAPNGSVVEFNLDSGSKSLGWKVEKGYFEFRVQGMDGWKAIGLSGQSGSQQWDSASRSVAVNNSTPPSPADPYGGVLVSPASHLFARVMPGATVQFSRYDGPGGFVTSATGGQVAMFNALSGIETDLASRNLVYVGGRTDQTVGYNPGDTRRVLLAGIKSAVELSGFGGKVTVAPGDTQVMQGPEGSRLEARANENGEVTIKAVGGRFVFFTKLDQRVGVVLEPGNEVIVTVDMKAGVATVNGSAENAPKGAGFLFVDPNDTGALDRGAGIELLPKSGLTIALERTGLAPGSEATMVFYEAAGEGGSNPTLTQGAAGFGTPVLSGRSAGSTAGETIDGMDGGRVAQPPLSPIR
jgi:hypothetical protein